MLRGQPVPVLAAGGGNTGVAEVLEASVPVGWRVSPHWDLAFRWARACRPGRVVPVSGGAACAAMQLSISSELTSNYMVNGVSVKSSSLSSWSLNASLGHRQLRALPGWVACSPS